MSDKLQSVVVFLGGSDKLKFVGLKKSFIVFNSKSIDQGRDN